MFEAAEDATSLLAQHYVQKDKFNHNLPKFREIDFTEKILLRLIVNIFNTRMWFFFPQNQFHEIKEQMQ